MQKHRDDMASSSVAHLGLSGFMLASGVAGGWALTHKLAGTDAAVSFLSVGATMIITLLMAQLILARMAQKRVVYLILYNIAFISSIIGFLSCLILPMLWFPSIGLEVKLLLSLMSLVLWYSNVSKGIEIMELKWDETAKKSLFRFYSKHEGAINWTGLLKSLKLSVVVYIPGVPKSFDAAISILVVAFMLAGLSLRNTFPIFSVFAWGIPMIVAISTIMQMIGFGVAQFMKLTALEKQDGVIIRPA